MRVFFFFFWSIWHDVFDINSRLLLPHPLNPNWFVPIIVSYKTSQAEIDSSHSKNHTNVQSSRQSSASLVSVPPCYQWLTTISLLHFPCSLSFCTFPGSCLPSSKKNIMLFVIYAVWSLTGLHSCFLSLNIILFVWSDSVPEPYFGPLKSWHWLLLWWQASSLISDQIITLCISYHNGVQSFWVCFSSFYLVIIIILIVYLCMFSYWSPLCLNSRWNSVYKR